MGVWQLVNLVDHRLEQDWQRQQTGHRPCNSPFQHTQQPLAASPLPDDIIIDGLSDWRQKLTLPPDFAALRSLQFIVSTQSRRRHAPDHAPEGPRTPLVHLAA